MKGKIFKRVASAMLGLMVAFAAIGVNTAFADDDPTIKDTKPKIIVTNYQNDGAEADSLVHCDVILVLTADNDKFNGKEVEFDSLTYTVEFPASFIKSATTIYHQDLFPTTGYQQTFTLSGQTTITGTIAKTDPHAKSLKGTIGQNILLARLSFARASKLDKTAEISIKGVVTACTNGEVSLKAFVDEQIYNVTDCIHPADKVTYTLPEDQVEALQYHLMTCNACNSSPIKVKHAISGNTKIVTGTADILPGTYGKCICGKTLYANMAVEGTETKTSDGKDILGNQGLNAVEKEYVINGTKCGSIIAVDATNFYKGGALDMNTGSAGTVNGFYVWNNSVITVDGKNAAAPAKKVIFVAREITGGLTFDQFVELYKKFGGQGSVISHEITHNGKRYMCAWESGINPYFVPTSAPAENKKEEEKKSTTSKSGKSAKTGDAAGMVCLAASGLLVVAGLYMELMKKKKNA